MINWIKPNFNIQEPIYNQFDYQNSFVHINNNLNQSPIFNNNNSDYSSQKRFMNDPPSYDYNSHNINIWNFINNAGMGNHGFQNNNFYSNHSDSIGFHNPMV